ncbi:MAG: hypothetical protein OXL41_15540 [Nitrospinae bacterium]|nr:hypothetical protein [Nitrospinota bacterium]
MRRATHQAVADIAGHEGKTAFVLYHLSTAGGKRVFCGKPAPDALIGQGGRIHFLDGSRLLDGSLLLGDGAEVLLGLHDWVEDGGRFSLGAFQGPSILEAYREKELSGLTTTINNAPDAEGHPRMSRILATEPLVGGRVDVRVGFSGQNLSDVLSIGSFTIRRIIERIDSVTIECEGN